MEDFNALIASGDSHIDFMNLFLFEFITPCILLLLCLLNIRTEYRSAISAAKMPNAANYHLDWPIWSNLLLSISDSISHVKCRRLIRSLEVWISQSFFSSPHYDCISNDPIAYYCLVDTFFILIWSLNEDLVSHCFVIQGLTVNCHCSLKWRHQSDSKVSASYTWQKRLTTSDGEDLNLYFHLQLYWCHPRVMPLRRHPSKDAPPNWDKDYKFQQWLQYSSAKV